MSASVPIPGRISLVTLGVTNLDRSRAFYDALGWDRVGNPEGVAFYRTGGALLSLYPLESLAADVGVEPTRTGFSGMSLAINVESPAAVDAAFETATVAGATNLASPAAVFWGGYVAYFADPDGHTWEVAYNPEWPLDAAGLPQLP
ncbi:MAG: VOC family protein [Acidimicrobiia bacterium]